MAEASLITLILFMVNSAMMSAAFVCREEAGLERRVGGSVLEVFEICILLGKEWGEQGALPQFCHYSTN